MSYMQNAIRFCFENDGHADTCYNMGEPWKHYAKWNKPDTKGQILHGSNYLKYVE